MCTFIQHTNEDKDGFSFSIMEQEGNAFGHAYIYKVNNSVIFLDMLSVSPEYRRQGIAKELLTRVVNEAREYGCGTVQITASDMGVLLYTNFGFVKNNNFMQYKL